MTEKHAGLTQNQLDSYWMPYTANRQFKADPRIITAAKGSYLTDAEGRQIFDGLSGLWCCGLGHGVPEISEAVSAGVKELDYAPAFQYGHPKAFQLAEKVTEFMPEGLNRVFFTNSGSEAADTSLKIARAYWRKKGVPSKTKLIGRIKGYHGVNFGGISVGGIGANRALFGDAVSADHLSHTMIKGNEFSKGQPETGADLADELMELVTLHDASNVAAVIVEPLAGSAGVLPPPEGYLQRLRKICDDNNILLIFDEVICGFGRMGANTGAEAFGVLPDMINIAKQVTNNIPARERNLRQMRELVDRVATVLEGDGDLDEFGYLMHEHWMLKRELSVAVSTDIIDGMYCTATNNGALGGKLMGAGGTGFMVFYVREEQQDAVRNALSNYLHVPFRFENEGSSLIYSASEFSED